MGDDEEKGYTFTLLNDADGLAVEEPVPTNWVAGPGRARVEYPDGCVYEGDFNDEKMKHGGRCEAAARTR